MEEQDVPSRGILPPMMGCMVRSALTHQPEAGIDPIRGNLLESDVARNSAHGSGAQELSGSRSVGRRIVPAGISRLSVLPTTDASWPGANPLAGRRKSRSDRWIR